MIRLFTLFTICLFYCCSTEIDNKKIIKNTKSVSKKSSSPKINFWGKTTSGFCRISIVQLLCMRFRMRISASKIARAFFLLDIHSNGHNIHMEANESVITSSRSRSRTNSMTLVIAIASAYPLLKGPGRRRGNPIPFPRAFFPKVLQWDCANCGTFARPEP